MTLITGGERRRRWSGEDRARILAAIDEPGAVVAEVARRAEVCTILVYKWRREARRGASGSGSAQLVVETPPELPAPAANESDGGARLFFETRSALTRPRWARSRCDFVNTTFVRNGLGYLGKCCRSMRTSFFNTMPNRKNGHYI